MTTPTFSIRLSQDTLDRIEKLIMKKSEDMAGITKSNIIVTAILQYLDREEKL